MSRANIVFATLFRDGVNSQWNQPWIFRGSRRRVRRVFMKYWFFFRISPPSRVRWHNGGLPSATAGRRFKYRRKMHNCLKFKCCWCCDRSNQPVLMYHVSSCRCVRYIIERITGSCVRARTHAHVAAEFEMRWIIVAISNCWDRFATVDQYWNFDQKTICL